MFDPLGNISSFICGFSEESGHLFSETEGYSNTLSHMCLSANYLPFYCFSVFHAVPEQLLISRLLDCCCGNNGTDG